SARHRLATDGFEEAIARNRAQAEEILKLKAELAGVATRLPAEADADAASGPAAGCRRDRAAVNTGTGADPAVPGRARADAGERPDAVDPTGMTGAGTGSSAATEARIVALAGAADNAALSA